MKRPLRAGFLVGPSSGADVSATRAPDLATGERAGADISATSAPGLASGESMLGPGGALPKGAAGTLTEGRSPSGVTDEVRFDPP